MVGNLATNYTEMFPAISQLLQVSARFSRYLSGWGSAGSQWLGDTTHGYSMVISHGNIQPRNANNMTSWVCPNNMCIVLIKTAVSMDEMMIDHGIVRFSQYFQRHPKGLIFPMDSGKLYNTLIKSFRYEEDQLLAKSDVAPMELLSAICGVCLSVVRFFVHLTVFTYLIIWCYLKDVGRLQVLMIYIYIYIYIYNIYNIYIYI